MSDEPQIKSFASQEQWHDWLAEDYRYLEDFIAALKQHKEAYAFFQTLSKANIYAIAWRLQTAKKPETRERRFKVLLEMLLSGERPH